jgi:hypothetical protein
MHESATRAARTAIFALLLFPVLASAQVGGVWEGHITSSRGDHIITKARLAEEGGQVTGELSRFGRPAQPICNGTFDGQMLSFQIDPNWREGKTCADMSPSRALRFEARLKGPSLIGTVDDDNTQGSLFWIQVDEADVTTAALAQPTPEPAIEPTPEPAIEPTPEPAVEPTPEPAIEPTPEPAIEPTPEPAIQPTPVAAAPAGPMSPYEATRAYITSVRGEDPAPFVAVWNAKDRQEGAAVLEQIFAKARPKLRQIADAVELRLSTDAFRLVGDQAILTYDCTTREGQPQECSFTVVQEPDGAWYVVDLD